MKKILLLLAFTLILVNTLKAQLGFFDIGEPATHYPEVKWIQGEPITKLEENTIYVVELWATWCKPCIAAMPHISELNKKFGDKVIFIGQNVWERNAVDDREVVRFVSSQGDKLNYRVGFAGIGQNNDFVDKWVKSAGISSIPTTIIIKNNKVAWITQPESLTDKVMELLIGPKFSISAAELLLKEDEN